MAENFTKTIIDHIFKEPGIKYELTEFETLGKPIHELLHIHAKTVETGRETGKTKYFLKSFVPFSSGKDEIQVHVEGGKSAPEEIVRQLWVYKLIHQYGYKPDEIDLEKSVQFGTEVGTKAADIIVYTDNTKETPKIIVECKKPKRKDGIEQLKSYMNAKGAPVAVWSNGSDSIILYRPYPKEFDNTLFDIPKRGQQPKDVLSARKTLLDLKREFNFKEIIQGLEELVLADSGKDEFNEIFKLIFAKIWDETQAQEVRKDKTVEFGQVVNPKTGVPDPDLTYDRIDGLFKKACDAWPGIFRPGEDIELMKRHLQICVGRIEGVRLMGSNLRIMDDAFEYLLPTEAKKKKGQFFTPRHVVEMCVRMLNPKKNEFIMDPACGSAGFLLHAMEWCFPARDHDKRELRKFKYASKYLWGIDFETRAAKTSRALMLIAGDGHTKIFGPDVSSLDPKTWYETGSGQTLMHELRQAKLTAKRIPENETLKDEDQAWEYFEQLKFDVILTNPPFAGEMKDRKMLAHYELAKPALKRAKDKSPKEERDVLFIERVLKMLKPGGRAAIVLPQGKFNNSSLAFIREWILKKARLLAVVGLHPNTFKPHTGTKTSVLFFQKYTDEALANIEKVKQAVANACPDYEQQIKDLITEHSYLPDVPDEKIPEEIADLMSESFIEPEPEMPETETGEGVYEMEEPERLMAAEGNPTLAELIGEAEEKRDALKAESRRLDAEHFYPAFQRLAAHIPDHINLVPLGTQLRFCQRGKQPVYSANGLPVINSKHVQSNKIVFEDNRKAAPNPIADLQIRYDDTLLNGTGRGTLGRAAPYLTDGQAIPDNHVTILRSPTLDPAYLSFYLNSQAGQLQVEMHQRGTSGQLELYPFDIRKFLVWVAPEPFQKEIRKLYDRAAESEQKSRELLDQAKTRVEQLIEEAAR